MKYLLFILLSLSSYHAISQKGNDESIQGFYQVIGHTTFYRIDSSFISCFSFCIDPHLYGICGYSLNVDKAKYSFRNDTLMADFGYSPVSIDISEITWIYLPSRNRFIDDGIGEYIKVSPGKINELLNSFCLEFKD